MACESETLNFAADLDDACGKPSDAWIMTTLEEHGNSWEWQGGKLCDATCGDLPAGDVLTGMTHVQVYEWLGY